MECMGMWALDLSLIHHYVYDDPYMFVIIVFGIKFVSLFYLYNLTYIFHNSWWAYINKPP